MVKQVKEFVRRLPAALCAGLVAVSLLPLSAMADDTASPKADVVPQSSHSGTAQSSWTTITNVTETDPESGDYHKSYGWRIVSTVTITDDIVTDVSILGKGIAMPSVPEMELQYYEPCHYYMEENIVNANIDATKPDSVDAVDVVSGATQTSYWIKEATKEALVKWNAAIEADLANATVKLAASSYTYTGKAFTPAVTVVSNGGVTLTQGTDYTVAYANNVNAGKATVTVTGIGNYNGTNAATFQIAPATQTIKAAKATYKVKYAKVKKKAQKVAVKFTANGGGKVTYAAAKSGKVSIAKNGKVTVKKGAKKGTYTLKVKVTAAAKGNYAKTTSTVKLKVKVA